MLKARSAASGQNVSNFDEIKAENLLVKLLAGVSNFIFQTDFLKQKVRFQISIRDKPVLFFCS